MRRPLEWSVIYPTVLPTSLRKLNVSNMNFKENIFILLLLSLIQVNIEPCSAQENATQNCKSEWIATLNVGSCTCVSGKDPKCQSCPLQCGGNSFSKLIDCGKGCSDTNMACDSCFIWFDQVCNCVKSGNCQHSPTTPAWMLLAPGTPDAVISTTQQMSGILELNSDVPWDWGQSILSRRSQALVINSVLRRSQEQIHIHVCQALQSMQTKLGTLRHQDFQKMTAVPNDHALLCRAEQDEATPITRVMADIQQQIASAACKDYVGAAVVVDDHNRAWACVTTDTRLTQDAFCSWWWISYGFLVAGSQKQCTYSWSRWHKYAVTNESKVVLRLHWIWVITFEQVLIELWIKPPVAS